MYFLTSSVPADDLGLVPTDRLPEADSLVTAGADHGPVSTTLWHWLLQGHNIKISVVIYDYIMQVNATLYLISTRKSQDIKLRSGRERQLSLVFI